MRIFVWGTNSIAKEIIDRYIYLNNIIGFISNSENRIDFLGKKCYRPDAVVDMEYDAIVVTVRTYSSAFEIRNQSLQIGINPRKMIFTCPDCDAKNFPMDYELVRFVFGREYTREMRKKYCFADRREILQEEARDNILVGDFQNINGFVGHIARLTSMLEHQQRILDLLLTDLPYEIDCLENTLSAQGIMWKNEREREYLQANFGDVILEPDFSEKYLRLISGMDEKSIGTVFRILARQKAILSRRDNTLDLYTHEEQNELRILRDHFKILKLSDNLYVYEKYLLPVNHFEASVFYYKHGLSQVKTLKKVKGKTIIDAGGYIGDSVLILSELEPSKIYTFEALPENFALLQRTLELNHVENVVPENVALGEKAGTLTLHRYGGASTFVKRPEIEYKEHVDVPVITLDDYVAEHQIEVGLIKVDIEGAEPMFLEGAKRTICEQKPILLLSIYHNSHDFFELKPLIESWNLGYKFSIYKPTFGPVTAETLLIAEVCE